MERLLRSQADSATSIYDLGRLFLLLRQDTAGREFVAEIADHVAHPEGRERGAVTHTANGFFACVSLYLHRLSQGNTLDTANLPPEFPLAIRTALVRLDKAALRKATGLGQKDAAAALESGLTKFSAKSDGWWTLEGDLNPQEDSVLYHTAGALIARPAFTDIQLMDQLVAVLSHHKLITAAEGPAFRKLRPLITLFAVTAMHDSRVIPPHGTRCHLLASAIIDAEANISVGALSRHLHPTKAAAHLNIFAPMFVTSIKAQDYCDEDLLKKKTWAFPIELTVAPLRLRRL